MKRIHIIFIILLILIKTQISYSGFCFVTGGETCALDISDTTASITNLATVVAGINSNLTSMASGAAVEAAISDCTDNLFVKYGHITYGTPTQGASVYGVSFTQSIQATVQCDTGSNSAVYTITSSPSSCPTISDSFCSAPSFGSNNSPTNSSTGAATVSACSGNTTSTGSGSAYSQSVVCAPTVNLPATAILNNRVYRNIQ